MESFRDWGRDCWCESGKDNTCGKRFSHCLGTLPQGYDHKYTYSHFGYNLKVTDMQAAVGCAQLDKLPYFTERRRQNFDKLYNGLSPLLDVLQLPEATANSTPSWFGFLVTLRDRNNLSRDYVVRQLEERGIQTRMLFAGNLTRQPAFDGLRASGNGYRIVGDLKNTDYIMANSFWLGVYPGMTDAMLEYMVNQVTEIVKG